MSKLNRQVAILAAVFVAAFPVFSQQAVGTISGTVTDAAGVVIPNANITITNKGTNAERTDITNDAGLYSAPSLPPGDYEVRVSLQGFQPAVRDALVEAGKSTVANFAMTIGASTEVRFEAVAPLVNYEGTNVVSGNVNRETTEAIPLNGRSSMQTTALEPGVAVTATGTGISNGLFVVSIPGGSVGTTRYMVDGGIINDESNGGAQSAAMNFSQEIVQATQVNSLSFDPSYGIGAGGAVNTVTRSGANDFHGDAFFFYRDHNMASYPALKRSTIDPTPFFQRKDPGFYFGGPIIKNKLFFFGSYERLQQTQVVNFQMDLPSLQAMNVIEPSPLHYNWASVRFDYHLSDKSAMFLRYTHDNSVNIYGTGNQAGWYDTSNWSDQAAYGFTRVLSTNIVNDFRAFYHLWQNQQLLFSPDPASGAIGADQPGYGSANLSCISAVACIGSGDPAVNSMVGSGTIVDVARYGSGPQMHQMRTYEVKDGFNWQKGRHQIRFGIDVEDTGTDYRPYGHCWPACVSLYSVESTESLDKAFPAGAFANLPTSINSTAALNSLPIENLPEATSAAGVSVGNGTFPGAYENGSGVRFNWRIQPYIGDTWKVTDSLSVNYGLEYSLETGLFPYNMPVPSYLNPILEGQTGGQPYGTGSDVALNTKDFGPVVGFAWALGKSKKTVIRGGAGIYWDTIGDWWQMGAEAAMGPAGNGRSQYSASVLTNIFPNMYYNSSTGVVPLPIGAPLPLNALSTITLGDFNQIINQELPAINAALDSANGGIVTSGPYKYSGVQVGKAGTYLFPENFPFMHSYQTSIGVQRELPGNMVISADFVRRLGEHVNNGSGIDLNKFTRVSDGLSPVIPQCATTPDFNPNDECSNGGITFWMDTGRSVYDALLAKVQKRLSNHLQFLVSYALQKQVTQNASQDLNNYFATYGPTLPRQNLNISGTGFLPWGFRLTINSNITTATPGNPIISGVDLNGGGNTSFELSLVESGLLPYGCMNFSCGHSQLAAAVASFNATYAGTKSLNGVIVPTLTLPSSYQTGAPIINQDVRLTKEFVYKEKYRLQVFGEVFNVLNIGNLTYGNLTLNSSAFGLPTARVGQTSTFSSGGPRAEQFGARISF